MKFISSRNDQLRLSFKEAVIKGISDDGGLFLPEEFPNVDLAKLVKLNYKEMAYEIIKEYASDFSQEELNFCIDRAYDEKFPEIVAPLTRVGEDFYLELYHGPTLAFKDFALSILPKFIQISKKSLNIKEDIMILTATSGDTGSAALEAFSDQEGIYIGVFFPEYGISPIQKLQMVTNKGKNTMVSGINGNFDQAQTSVKELFADEKFTKTIKDKNVIFSSANSINIGRLIPQIVYYFFAYKQLLDRKEIQLGEKVSFSVPTGNFGDILALYYAKEMGLPVEKLIVASNENKVLTDFFKSGQYDKKRDLIVTNSPSMDIIISSNLERLLYHKTRDAKLVANLQEGLKKNGVFSIKADFSDFYPGFCRQDETLEEIKKLFETTNYLMDTHTAVASYVKNLYKESRTSDEKLIVVSTASPYKFSSSILKALDLVESFNPFDSLKAIERYTNVEPPKRILDLENAKINHKLVLDPEQIKDSVIDFIDNHILQKRSDKINVNALSNKRL